VSAALNNSPAARSIPEHTKNRIIEAAQALNYRPIFLPHPAPETHLTIGVDREEIGDAYGSMVISASKNICARTIIFPHGNPPSRSKVLQTYAQMLF